MRAWRTIGAALLAAACSQNTSVVNCTDDTQCHNGQHCADGQCLANTCTGTGCACTTTSDCAAGLVCNGESCEPAPSCGDSGCTCNTASDCNPGLTCATGRCAASTSCLTLGCTCSGDAGCVGGLVCTGGHCAASTSCLTLGCTCSGDAGCVGGLVCTGGHCATAAGTPDAGSPPVVSCTSDAQCTPPSTICATSISQCVAGCAIRGSCSTDYACNTSTGHCALSIPAPTSGSIYFAVFGDTRPGTSSDPYPTVPGTIFGQISQRKPHYVFVVGDYVEASSASAATPQFNTFLSLQHHNYTWTGPVYYVVGNHESAVLSTYQTALNTRLYYAVEDTAQNAKYVVIGDNAWDATQKSWLQTELAKTTKYTFVFRHHPYTAYGLDTTVNADIISVIDAHPSTLVIAGHDHSFYVSRRHWMDSTGWGKEIVSGNGGAPLAASTAGDPPNDYGYVLVQSLPSGNVAVVSYSATTNQPTSYHDIANP